MKNSIKTIMSFVALLTLVSCVTDYQGQLPDESQFTATNYVYEGDLYRIYLEDQIAKADPKTDSQQIAIWKDELKNIINLSEIGLDLIPPVPPCPRPRNCDFFDVKFLLLENKAEKAEALFYNDKNEVIGGGEITEFSPYPDDKGLIKVANLKIEDYNDKLASIQVKIFRHGEITRSYLVE